MRKYVQEGIKRDTHEFVEQVAAVNRAVKVMRSVWIRQAYITVTVLLMGRKDKKTAAFYCSGHIGFVKWANDLFVSNAKTRNQDHHYADKYE